jgi:hypothetical protein
MEKMLTRRTGASAPPAGLSIFLNDFKQMFSSWPSSGGMALAQRSILNRRTRTGGKIYRPHPK